MNGEPVLSPPVHGELLEETARPSVKLTRNAKGDVQIEVKVYGLDASEDAAVNAAAVAQGIYDQLSAKYGSET